MIKRPILCYLLMLLSLFMEAQLIDIDSLAREANAAQNDTARLVRMRTVARIYAEFNPDSGYHYAEKALEIARRLHLQLDEASALREMGYAFLNKNNYPRSLQNNLSSLAILEDPSSEKRVLVGKFPGDDDINNRIADPHLQRLGELGFTHQIMGILYANANNYERSWYHHLRGREYATQSGNVPLLGIVHLTFNRVYLNLKKNDSALLSIQLAYDELMRSGYKRYVGSVLLNMGRTYAAMGNIPLANEYYRKSLVVSKEQGYFRGVVAASILLAEYYTKMGKKDSAFQYINQALHEAGNLESPDLLLRSYTALTRHYQNAGNSDSVAKYQALIIKISENLFNAKQAQQFQNIDFDERQRRQEIEDAEKELRARWRMYVLGGGLSIFLLIAIMLWRNTQQRKKANLLLSKQKGELESTLSTLKTTQNQLIQTEKMASLGELTAGIAHEIQNPLNFVNNFSEVNNELIDEVKSHPDWSGTKLKSEELDDLLNHIFQNNEKISYHGKRADAIVKGMLQHSRSSSGQKEPTDINALVDEYLRLSYHGLRAKDKSFNVTTKTEFDNDAGKIDIVPQEIGRVILNLITNAFYAVNEKQKVPSAGGVGYEPIVTVSTAKDNGKVEIRVKDNGNGIPQKILDKIFQPFFTTKPTGEGTGLGLSLAYDIVTKGHSGELKVETKEGEGSAFIIRLPATKTSGL